MNHYEVLGVAPDSDLTAIRRAYLDLARQHHPDFHVDADDGTRAASAVQMQLLNEAWKVLGDEDQRRAYDRALHTSTDPGVARRAAREPGMPEGKGWTPRAGDDRWMTDFQGWAEETDELPPDEPRSPGRRLATLLPVGLLLAGVGALLLGAVLGLRQVVALGAVCLVFAFGLFFLLPMVEMARSRRR
ncbi:MAG: DnaJ domain-containing protein [Acidimicrobiales bacterium]